MKRFLRDRGSPRFSKTSLLRSLKSGLVAAAMLFSVTLVAIAPAGATQVPGAHPSKDHATSSLTMVTSRRTYATALFSKMPLPTGVVMLATPIAPLRPVIGALGVTNIVDIARYYLVPSSLNVVQFANAHFPRSDSEGSGTSVGAYEYTSASFAVLSLCSNRHASYCGVTYSARGINGDRQEMRVDVTVVWMPIHVVHLPTTGVVTITGYDKISLSRSSSIPVRVKLNTSQTMKLRSDIALLRSAPGGLCMEDSTLYKISVVPKTGGKIFWSAIADECPGNLTVESGVSRTALTARSCPLDKLVTSFFPSGEAKGTKSGLQACQPSLP